MTMLQSPSSASLGARVARMRLQEVEPTAEGATGGQLLKRLAREGLCREIWHRWQELPGEDPAARMVLLEQAYQALEQAPTAALIERRSHPCRSCGDGLEAPEELAEPPLVFVLWCPSESLLGWPCVKEGCPWPELLPLVRRPGGATLSP